MESLTPHGFGMGQRGFDALADVLPRRRQRHVRCGPADQHDVGRAQRGGFIDGPQVVVDGRLTHRWSRRREKAATAEGDGRQAGGANPFAHGLRVAAVEPLAPDRDAADAGRGVGVDGLFNGPGLGRNRVNAELVCLFERARHRVCFPPC